MNCLGSTKALAIFAFRAIFIIICFHSNIKADSLTRESQLKTEPLVTDSKVLSESVLEAFLSPAEFSDRRFVYETTGDEAVFCLDAILSASPPVLDLHPNRVEWPKIADMNLLIDSETVSLLPVSNLTDDILDRGFKIRWTIQAQGQRFEPNPHFSARVVDVQLISIVDRKRLAGRSFGENKLQCTDNIALSEPSCTSEIGLETRALSMSPDGSMLSLAFGGLSPRLEVYDVRHRPKLLWSALFSKKTGGAVETAFSSDGRWVTALSGKGVLHRFDARSGERHKAVFSSGITAAVIPPGRIAAVGGQSGEVTLWYLADGTIARRIFSGNRGGSISSITASGNGKVIATLDYANEKSIVRVWSVKTRKLIRQLEVEGRTIVYIALDDPGKTLFSAHETRGLLSASLEDRSSLEPVAGTDTSKCTGRIEWIPSQKIIVCSTKKGLFRIKRDGSSLPFLTASTVSSEWIASVSSGGSKIAAAGGGYLIIWKTE